MSQKKKLPPVHPGEILLEDFMKPIDLSVNGLAMQLGVPATRIGAIVHGKRGITADTALRLARYFNTSSEFWMRIQNRYELDMAFDLASADIERVVRPRA